jgi:hypothetical protein
LLSQFACSSTLLRLTGFSRHHFHFVESVCKFGVPQ